MPAAQRTTAAPAAASGASNAWARSARPCRSALFRCASAARYRPGLADSAGRQARGAGRDTAAARTAGPEASPTSAGRNATASHPPTASASRVDLLAVDQDSLPPAAPVGRPPTCATGPPSIAGLDLKPGALEPRHLLVRRAAEGAEQHRVVDRLEEVGLALGVGAQEHQAGRRELALEVREVSEPPGHQMAEPHYRCGSAASDGYVALVAQQDRPRAPHHDGLRRA